MYGKTESELLRSGACVGFCNVKTDVTPSLDGETAQVSIELMLGEEAEDEEPEDLVEWAAFGFIFVLASLSFSDARPRGNSDIEYDDKDVFSLADFVDGISFQQGALCYSADYLKGRLLKTDIRVSQNGTVSLTTHSRGKQAIFWLDRLKGKKPLQLVS